MVSPAAVWVLILPLHPRARAAPPQVFGPKKTRKKPKLSVPDLDALVTTAADKVEK